MVVLPLLLLFSAMPRYKGRRKGKKKEYKEAMAASIAAAPPEESSDEDPIEATRVTVRTNLVFQ